MNQETSAAVPYSVLLIMDPEVGRPPTSFGVGTVASTPTCVAVTVLNDADGPVSIELTDSATPSHNSPVLLWTGELETSGRIAVLNVYHDVLLVCPARGVANVAIWANNTWEPDQIQVLVDQL